MNACNVYVCAHRLHVQAICKGVYMGRDVCMYTRINGHMCSGAENASNNPCVLFSPVFNARHKLLQRGTSQEASSSLILMSGRHMN